MLLSFLYHHIFCTTKLSLRMSDDEVIRFEITDYDLDNEFNPNRNRKAKKEQQIYGKNFFNFFMS